MKLIRNDSEIPDKLIKSLFGMAMTRAGVKFKQKVSLDVRQNRSTWYMYGQTWGSYNVKLNVPKFGRINKASGFETALSFYSVMVHEAKHLADAQDGRSFKYNKNWKNRPQEIRAEITAKLAVAEVKKKHDKLPVYKHLVTLAKLIEQKGRD